MQNEENKLYVGNIPYEATSKDLIEFFSLFGHVQEAMIITNNKSGRSKGYGFVTFETEAETRKALTATGSEFMGRSIIIQETNSSTNGD